MRFNDNILIFKGRISPRCENKVLGGIALLPRDASLRDATTHPCPLCGPSKESPLSLKGKGILSGASLRDATSHPCPLCGYSKGSPLSLKGKGILSVASLRDATDETYGRKFYGRAGSPPLRGSDGQCPSLQIVLLLALLLLLTTACGNKRGPTGGPADLTRPEILYTTPDQYEQIEKNEIVIAFSKVMDKSSVLSGLNVHPQILSKKIFWKKNDLHIAFSEALPENKNIIIFLNKSIKCERGNALEDHQILTFKNGTLQENTLSGYITQNEDFVGKDVNFTLLDSDSLLVLTHTSPEISYSFTNLNPGKHTLSAYIDINTNNRFDYTIDAAYSRSLELPVTSNINITLAIADTTKPVITSITSPQNNQVNIRLNKEITNVPIFHIYDDSTHTEIQILHKELIKDTIYLSTAPLDSLIYRMQVGPMTDKAGNTTPSLQKELNSIGQPPQNAPQIRDTSPKNGNVIKVKFPDLALTFDQIMFSRDIVLTLTETESGRNIPLTPSNTAGLTITYKPATGLLPFNTYQLTVHKETADNCGNTLTDDQSLLFIVTN